LGVQVNNTVKTILLVEDEVIIALLEKSWLVSEGYNVINVHSGEHAVDIACADDSKIDIILMDIDLGGGMEGPEAAEIILKKKDIPILFLTSHSEKEIVEKTEKISSYGYVIKDTTGNVLFASIKMAFKLYEANKELKRKEEALFEGEAKYRSLFENMTAGFALHQIIYDVDGKPVDYAIVDANPAFEKMTGANLNNIIGKRITELVPEISRYFLNTIFEVAESGVATAFSNYNYQINKYFDTWLFSTKKGQVAALFSDITNRKLAEEALQTRIIALTRPLEGVENLEFKDLFDINEVQKIQDAFCDATGVASLILEPDGTPITKPSNFCFLCNDIVRKNERGSQNCTYSDVELGKKSGAGPSVQRCLSSGLWDGGTSIQIGNKTIARWLVGQVRDESFDLDEMTKYADEIGTDKEAYRKALEDVPVMSKQRFENICKAVYLIGQQLSNLAAQNVQQARFITEKRRAEQAQQLSDEILKQLPDTILLADTKGNITRWMGSSKDLFGYTHNEVIGKNISDFLLKTSEKEISLFEELRQKGNLIFEAPFTKKDGTEISVESQFSIFYDELHKPVAIIGINRDITERKKAEQEIKKINKELAELNSSKDKLFTIISHDLKGPFAGFLGITEELMNNVNNLSKEEIHNFASVMNLTAEKMNTLMNNLLEWAKMQAGKLEYNPASIRLKDLTQNIENLYSSSAASKSITIVDNIAEHITVLADRYMLALILRNLISNAVKFTPDGGEININYRITGRLVEISVTDNGVGIDDEALHRLFAIDSGYTTKGTNGEEGTGLGLVICKEMIEKNGGSLNVSSSVGKGSTFSFTLPEVPSES
jgi:PAS domain S-box-containing protein